MPAASVEMSETMTEIVVPTISYRMGVKVRKQCFGSGSAGIRMFLSGPDLDLHKFADLDPQKNADQDPGRK